MSKYSLLYILALTVGMAHATTTENPQDPPTPKSTDDRFCRESLKREAQEGDVVTKAEDQDQSKGRPHIIDPFACFTGAMRIMAPRGDIAIRASAAGDSVWSYDVANKKYIHNRIGSITAHDVKECGVLRSVGIPIEVTGKHRFYDVHGKDYTAIEDLQSDALLLGFYPFVRGEHNRPTPVSLRRGPFEVVQEPRTVFEIKLLHPPYNYFVEGILVHNSKQTL